MTKNKKQKTKIQKNEKSEEDTKEIVNEEQWKPSAWLPIKGWSIMQRELHGICYRLIASLF